MTTRSRSRSRRNARMNKKYEVFEDSNVGMDCELGVSLRQILDQKRKEKKRKTRGL